MSTLKSIRHWLDLSQMQLAAVLGCTQGSVSAYERGDTTIPPSSVATLIAYAKSHGLKLTYDHVYGSVELPPDRRARSHSPG